MMEPGMMKADVGGGERMRGGALAPRELVETGANEIASTDVLEDDAEPHEAWHERILDAARGARISRAVVRGDALLEVPARTRVVAEEEHRLADGEVRAQE